MAEKKIQATKVTVSKRKRVSIKMPRVLRAIGGYFSGAWYELQQVHWPDRKATWGLTLAVIAFSGFFAALILGLDFVFQYLFKRIIL